MTIHIPRPIAIAAGALAGGVLLAMLAHQGPDLWKYLRAEGM